MTTTGRIPTRRVVTGAATLAAALGLAACGGGGEPPLDASVPVNPAQRAVDEAGARADEPLRFDGTIDATSSATGSLSIGVRGTVDPAGDADLELDFSDVLGALDPDIGDDLGLRVLVDGPDAYLRVPPFLAAELGSREWIGLEGEALERIEDAQLIADLQRSKATTSLGYLRGATDDVVLVDQVEGPGGLLHVYRGTIDFERAVERTPLEARPALRAQIEQLREGSIDGDRMEAEVWIDATGRVHREQLTFRVKADGEVATITVSLGFTDHGAPVEVEPPDPSLVTPYEDVEDELEG